ncbi:MAG: TetR/AcrR family transcriptional regulator [Thermoleophilaceae bacterium]|nr:TetR/AcrR family transcriptional regulator [Thermoleophilaceae bacterium]
MSEGRKPKQKRSRERVEKILLAAADELARASTAEDMTTTNVARRSGIPVSTLYRYFSDRSAIIAALIDKETAEIDAVAAERLAKLEEVSVGSALETIMYAHLEHFQDKRRSVLLWFGSRDAKAVLERVNRRYDYLGKWIYDGGLKAGYVEGANTPPWGGDAIIWTCDRCFEFIFREERSKNEQMAIMELFMNMVRSQILAFAPPEGAPVLNHEEFLTAFGPYSPPSAEDFA